MLVVYMRAIEASAPASLKQVYISTSLQSSQTAQEGQFRLQRFYPFKEPRRLSKTLTTLWKDSSCFDLVFALVHVVDFR